MAENNEEQSGGGLRKQLEDALSRIQELEGQVTEGVSARKELTFRKAGIDIDSGPGKLLAQTYDGDLDPEAVVTYAKEYGIEPNAAPAAQAEQPDPALQRADVLRAQSNPDGAGKRIDHKEWLAMNQTDPGAARAAWDAGQVDLPSHIEANLADNSTRR